MYMIMCVDTSVLDCFSHRRPFGTEQEYFVQLFLEYDDSMKLPAVGDLLTKMFKEQKISFTEVLWLTFVCYAYISQVGSFYS